MRSLLLLILLLPAIALAADTQVESATDTNLEQSGGLFGPFWSDVNTGVIVYHDSGDDPSWRRTTDGGASWGTDNDFAAEVLEQMRACYDKATPDDTGTTVHVISNDSTSGDFINYYSVDVSDGTTSSSTIDSAVTLSGSSVDNRNCIGKTRSGRIIAAFLTGTEARAYYSTDGSTWNAGTSPFDDTSSADFCMILAANTADDNDYAVIYHDVSANTLSVKMYDDSATSYTETNISTSITGDATYQHWDAAVRHSDGKILIAAHSAADSTTDDILTFEVNPDSIASPTVTAKTNVVTDQAEAGYAGIFINQINDDVYFAFTHGTTYRSATDVVFYKSTDDMSTWGTEQAYSEDTPSNIRVLHGGSSVVSAGGRYQPVFNDDGGTDIWINETYDIAIAAATPTPTPTPTPAGSEIFLLE